MQATKLPSSEDPLVKEKYVNGGCGWYQNVFKSDFETVAISDRKYELLRFWLLGSWIAQNQRLRFILVNLVPAEREKDIETQFKKHIKEDTSVYLDWWCLFFLFVFFVGDVCLWFLGLVFFGCVGCSGFCWSCAVGFFLFCVEVNCFLGTTS